MAVPIRYTNTCLTCGNIFEAKNCAAKYCPRCRHVRRVHSAPKTIYQIIREMEEYNRQHGVSLTYGQYVQLLKDGENDK